MVQRGLGEEEEEEGEGGEGRAIQKINYPNFMWNFSLGKFTNSVS